MDRIRTWNAGAHTAPVTAQQMQALLAQDAPSVLYRPLTPAGRRAPMGYAATCSFPSQRLRISRDRYADAAQAGLAQSLDAAVLPQALRGLTALPGDAFVLIAVSVDTLAAGLLQDVLTGWPTEQVVLHLQGTVTESALETLDKHMNNLRFSGIRFAMDLGKPAPLHTLLPEFLYIPDAHGAGPVRTAEQIADAAATLEATVILTPDDRRGADLDDLCASPATPDVLHLGPAAPLAQTVQTLQAQRLRA